MKTWIRRLLIGLAALLCLAAAAVALGLHLADNKFKRQVSVPDRTVPVPTDAVSLERGRYLFASRGCATCHGAQGQGHAFVDDPIGLRLFAPDITTAAGNVVANYRTEDWVRSIRQGVAPGGRALFVMPSEDFNRLSDEDTGALIAYLRQLPPGPGTRAEFKLPLPVRLAYGFGALQDSAEKIDPLLPPQPAVPVGVTAANGAYVSQSCIGCHGAHLSGGRIPGAPPSWPAAANLTPGPGSVMPRYADRATFIAMMRSGLRPDGSKISSEMPFEAFRAMSDVDLQALHLHLSELPPRAFGNR